MFWDDLQPFERATEGLTGVAVIPVAVVGPLRIDLAHYELVEPEGRLEERRRSDENVYVPLANTEGGLALSLSRGARAAAESGGFRTYVLRDRMTRASAFAFTDTSEAVEFAAWIERQVDEMRAWLAEARNYVSERLRACLAEARSHICERRRAWPREAARPRGLSAVGADRDRPWHCRR